jgi:type I restriction-modification system DNA methylase subunit
MTPDPATLTPSRLEAGLWAAAQALRGTVDAADYRGLILGAVFLKRLSDVSDEGDRAFDVPEAARWSSLRQVTAGVGEALQRACVRLERANPSLAGVLTAAGFDAAHRLGPAASKPAAVSTPAREGFARSTRSPWAAAPSPTPTCSDAPTSTFSRASPTTPGARAASSTRPPRW